MNGWYVDCSPINTPTARGATWARMGSPSATASSIRRRRSRQASGWRLFWASESDSGQPERSTIWRTSANSLSASG